MNPVTPVWLALQVFQARRVFPVVEVPLDSADFLDETVLKVPKVIKANLVIPVKLVNAVNEVPPVLLVSQVSLVRMASKVLKVLKVLLVPTDSQAEP